MECQPLPGSVLQATVRAVSYTHLDVYKRQVADVVKELGGKPFLTDCNTLYVGSRKNALEHIDTAYQNGFTPYATGCQVIIADGIKGTDETLVPVSYTHLKTICPLWSYPVIATGSFFPF